MTSRERFAVSRRDADPATVAVVVPAFNAGKTLAETLASVVSQTHSALEIVVVDDGSTDNTRDVADAFAATDPRVRVITQVNGGVARARNAGIMSTTAEFVAPVDADDLWHPEKIARQLTVMKAGGADIGFVYAPCRHIDEQSRVVSSSAVGSFEGWVFFRHLVLNFVGCGSSLLIRRAAFEEVGGYDPTLRALGVEGCEDYLLQLLIARHWQVGLVPDYLIGYRRTLGRMSADVVRMARSHLACYEIVSRRCPEIPASFVDRLRARYQADVFWGCLKRGRLGEALAALRDAGASSPWAASSQLIGKSREGLERRARARHNKSPSKMRPFFSVSPDESRRNFSLGFGKRQIIHWASMQDGPARIAPERGLFRDDQAGFPSEPPRQMS